MSFFQDFLTFLKNYQVIGLAVAFIIGSAATKLVTAVVNDIIMPLIGVLFSGGDWQTSILYVGSIKFMIGDLISVVLNFIVIALTVFFIVKFVMNEDPTVKK